MLCHRFGSLPVVRVALTVCSLEAALEKGHRVLATVRTSGHLIDIATQYGESVRTVSLDVTNEAQVKDAVDAAIDTFGA